MAKRLTAAQIILDFRKDEAGDIQIEANAHLTLTSDEYPELSGKKGIPITNTAAEETAIIKWAKSKLSTILADEGTVDGIPVPQPPPPPDDE